MSATIFSDVLSKGRIKNFRAGDVEIRDWFRDKALSVISKNMSINNVMNKSSAKTNVVSKVIIGRPVMYRYDPKHKDSLPYYDTFPIIFPIGHYKDGWLGLNLHYLPPVYRARLMDLIYDTLNNDRFDESTKAVINYKILNNAAKFKYFRPCVKRYLHSHVKSDLVQISIEEWDYVLFLPLARFQKAQQRTVWDNSIKKIMGGSR